MKINFYPDSDLQDFSESIKEYEDIWTTDGSRIIKVWEKITELSFQETYINAIVFDSKSVSHPLSLRYNLETDFKKSVLIHELGHRILYKRVEGGLRKGTKRSHMLLFLVLYDVFIELYGEEFANKVVQKDTELSDEYGEAWKWALSFNKDERKAMFKEIFENGYDSLPA